jgi:hypothetical protein
MHALRAVDQVGERQREQRLGLRDGRYRLTFAQFLALAGLQR